MFSRSPQCSWNSSSARRKPAASSARAASAILFLSERTEHASDVPKSMTGASSGSHVRDGHGSASIRLLGILFRHQVLGARMAISPLNLLRPARDN